MWEAGSIMTHYLQWRCCNIPIVLFLYDDPLLGWSELVVSTSKIYDVPGEYRLVKKFSGELTNML